MTREYVADIIKRCGPRTPHLRFDKVALRFVSDIQSALRDVVPNGKTLILTATAPLRLPARTAAALEQKIRKSFSSAKTNLSDTINGNQIRVRLVDGRSRRIPKVLGLVHNPDVDGNILLNAAQSLLK